MTDIQASASVRPTLSGHVLITGGAGSLGSAIIERAHDEGWDARFTVYSRDESKQAALRDRYADLTYRLGDIRDASTLARAMRGVDLVIHAAAYKRVPEAERESIACAEANVMGSIGVIDAALTAGVPKVIGISTDKAAHPINAYGQSKALMERLFQSQALSQQATAFHLVRYGNVLASRGSVVPALLSQVAKGEPITLTDPGMTRFWLTLDDAVDLVLRTLTIEPGEILIPACHSASMADMAQAIAPDWPTRLIGDRGGEKCHETLMHEHESPFARWLDDGWAVRSLATRSLNLSPERFAYTSDGAPRIPVSSLRETIDCIRAGRRVRLLQ